MKPAAARIIYVNDRPREIAGEIKLMELVRELGLEGKKGVAVAVNGGVVGRADWDRWGLVTGDRVLVIQATQGG